MIRLALAILLFCWSLGAATFQAEPQALQLSPAAVDACHAGSGTGTGDPRSAWIPAANAHAILSGSPWTASAPPAIRSAGSAPHLAAGWIRVAGVNAPGAPRSRQPLTLPLLI